MIGIVILSVIVLILVVLLLTPAQARFSYDQGDLAAGVRYGPVKLQIFPLKEKPKKEKTEKPDSKKKPKKAKKAKKKKKFSINKEQILYSLDKLPPILGRALRRTGRRVRICPLKVHLLIASADPADTALLYGRLEAALAAGLPTLRKLVHVKDEDIRLFLDFAENRIDCIADVGISIRPWDVLSIAVRTGASLVKWFFGFKKLASPEIPEEKENTSTEAA